MFIPIHSRARVKDYKFYSERYFNGTKSEWDNGRWRTNINTSGQKGFESSK